MFVMLIPNPQGYPFIYIFTISWKLLNNIMTVFLYYLIKVNRLLMVISFSFNLFETNFLFMYKTPLFLHTEIENDINVYTL